MTRTVLMFMIMLRCGGVLAAIAAAAIDDGDGISRRWQLLVLGGLALWASFFAVRAVRRGPRPGLVVADTVVVSLVLLVQERLVAVDAVADETTWAIMLASTAIYVAQLALSQLAGLATAAVLICAYMSGVPVVTSHVRILFVQALVVNALMWLLRRGGARADALVAERDREHRRAMVEAARRADERHHRSQMHDSVLATLGMVATGAVRGGSPVLARNAREALEVLEEFSVSPLGDDAAAVDLIDCLNTLAVEPARPVTATVHTEVARLPVPGPPPTRSSARRARRCATSPPTPASSGRRSGSSGARTRWQSRSSTGDGASTPRSSPPGGTVSDIRSGSAWPWSAARSRSSPRRDRGRRSRCGGPVSDVPVGRGEAALFAVWFSRAFDMATVITVGLWQVGSAGAALLVYLDQYRSPAGAVAIWGVQLLLIAVGAVLLLRKAGGDRAVGMLVSVDLLTGLAMAVNCPGELMLRINWTWATVGLIGVLLLLYRPMSTFVLFQAVNGGSCSPRCSPRETWTATRAPDSSPCCTRRPASSSRCSPRRGSSGSAAARPPRRRWRAGRWRAGKQ
ncbi:hypothetical protein LUX33_22750 [Actinomadura madurae]|nr:hypothetical protein [Actinomadura madurae]MCP9950953.1 hypothetical protein [Actinomadura madurae]